MGNARRGVYVSEWAKCVRPDFSRLYWGRWMLLRRLDRHGIVSVYGIRFVLEGGLLRLPTK